MSNYTQQKIRFGALAAIPLTKGVAAWPPCPPRRRNSPIFGHHQVTDILLDDRDRPTHSLRGVWTFCPRSLLVSGTAGIWACAT